MPTIIQEMIILKSRDEVYALAQDYNLRLDWDPFLRDIRFVSQSKELARGLQVWVKAHNRMEMTVEYVNYSPPAHVAMKMIDGPFIFSHFSGTWLFDEVDRTTTRVIFKYKFTPIFLFYPVQFIIRWFLNRDMKQRLIALKQYAETHDLLELV